MDEFTLELMKLKMESALRQSAEYAAKKEGVPEHLVGMLVVSAVGRLSERLKNNYYDLKSEYESSNRVLDLSGEEYCSMIDSAKSKVLAEFIEPNTKEDYWTNEY